MIKTNFYLKDSQGWNPQKKKKQKTHNITPVVLHVHYQNQRGRIYSGYSSKPSNWNFENQRYKTTKAVPNAIRLNERLNHIRSTAEAVYLDYLRANDNKAPAPAVFKEKLQIALNMKAETDLDLFSFFQQVIDHKIYDLGERSKRNSDVPTFEVTLQCLKEYASTKRVRVDFDTIDLDFYHNWKKYLLDDLGLKKNTAGTRIKRLKSVLARATAAGINKNLMYTDPGFKVLAEEVENIYLNEKELEALTDLPLNEHLSVIRDLFLCLAWTGQREGDLYQIRPGNIHNGTLQIKQTKTGTRTSVPVHQEVERILHKYNGVLPQRAQQYINRALKTIGAELQKKVKGDKDFSLMASHTGRRSFATNMILRGYTALEVMSATGHKTEREFYKYLKMSPTEMGSKMRMAFKNEVTLRKVN
ncbi:MAG: phage integrase SAM-like domain-containing protein [Bacteroidales bacterium]|nr:phage integrase SAM-like domain-containing protein [Bacteroidales bacterium]